MSDTVFTLFWDDRHAVALHATPAGRVLARGDLQPPRPGAEAALLEHALAAVPRPPDTVLVAVPQRTPAPALIDALRAVTPDVHVTSTHRAIAAAAHNSRPGLVVESSLRAAAYGSMPDHAFVISGDSGSPIGDEGSGLWLVTHALRLALFGLEGGMPRSERLERSFVGYFGADSLLELIENAEAGRIDRNEMAGFISVVLHLGSYPEPDPGCRVLVLQASRALAQLALEAARQGQWTEGVPIAACGEALHGPLLDATRDETLRVFPGATWVDPVLPPEAGTIILAAAARGDDASPLSEWTPP